MTRGITRRGFLQTGAAGAAALAAGPAALAAAAARTNGEGDVPMEHFREPARDTPIAERADVLVAGAGPAGVVAAVPRARRDPRAVSRAFEHDR